MNVAVTLHGGVRWKDGRREEIEPLRHAIADSSPRYSRTGHTYRAVCGAQVAKILDGTVFSPSHPRACSKCRKALGR